MNKNSGLKHLVEICVKKEVKTIIISPGSRNAPIVLAFARHPEIRVLSIVDERSAAFFALGMAQHKGDIITLACTSGSALLNYAPAIAEAYYQKLPLLVLSADRPLEWIDQADSQTIRQKDVFRNYIKKSFELPQNINTPDDLWYNDRLVCEAIDLCKYPESGPVHINLPFTEPLYDDFGVEAAKPKIVNTIIPEVKLDKNRLADILKRWKGYSKKLIISAMLAPNEGLAKVMAEIDNDPSVAILTETSSNLHNSNFNPCIDRVLATIGEDSEAAKPDLLITFGNQIISKKIKAFLRQNRPIEHWHISLTDYYVDTFQSLTMNIPMEPEQFFAQLLSEEKSMVESGYNVFWSEKNALSLNLHKDFLKHCEYSDLKVFESLLMAVPANSYLHLANSTPIRYAQLFNSRKDLTYFCNRGTSGIDGSLSAAVGSAFESQAPTTIITGDLAFFYDSNALWNKYLSPDLSIILINNGGGGIFRFIDGPEESGLLDLFETTHKTNAKGIAETHGLNYFKAETQKGMEKGIQSLYHPDNKKASILEIFTPRERNADILKEYFSYISKNS